MVERTFGTLIVAMTLVVMSFVLSGCVQFHHWPGEPKNETVTAPPPKCTTTRDSGGIINTVCTQ
jgi:hypothetical protein